MDEKTRIALIKELQEDLPECIDPFAVIARKIGCSEDEVLAETKKMVADSTIRRVGAMMRHRNLGVTANGMGVWIVAEEDTERIGQIMASFTEVSHCYQRPAFPDWPYNMFTMIHATSREGCDVIAQKIAKATGLAAYKLLFSTRELKKSSMKYFCEEA